MLTATIAIGGNAILRAGQKGTAKEQLANLRKVCETIATLIEQDYDVVLTHGNGPQVGNIVLQQDSCTDTVPAMPLDVCVAESQGMIGYMLQQTLQSALARRKIMKCVCSVVTQVVVDAGDPAFNKPTKPIGMYFSKEMAEKMAKERGWAMKEDKARGGYRRLVPSPRPIDIVEKDSIKRLVFNPSGGYIIIAAGGGGIPVISTPQGFKGVEAVIDKDLASGVLASSIDEKLFIMLTDVPQVYIAYGKPDQHALAKTTAAKMREYMKNGEFPAGSMGPKVEAAISFLEKGGKEVIITSPEALLDALAGKAGTRIVG